MTYMINPNCQMNNNNVFVEQIKYQEYERHVYKEAYKG